MVDFPASHVSFRIFGKVKTLGILKVHENGEFGEPGGQCVASPVPEFSKIRRWKSMDVSSVAKLLKHRRVGVFLGMNLWKKNICELLCASGNMDNYHASQ